MVFVEGFSIVGGIIRVFKRLALMGVALNLVVWTNYCRSSVLHKEDRGSDVRIECPVKPFAGILVLLFV